MKQNEAEAKDHRKSCTLCGKPRNILVRCQVDATARWHFLCPGSCWQQVSGGVIDGDKTEDHKFYRYGGMWKNKHEAVSAKKPKKKSDGNAASSSVSDGTEDAKIDSGSSLQEG